MDITLIERTCKSCGAKLTEYEVEEKGALCIECFNDEHADD